MSRPRGRAPFFALGALALMPGSMSVSASGLVAGTGPTSAVSADDGTRRELWRISD